MVARPFFMTLPGYPGRMDEKELLNDLEYLQQTYPGEVRRCQRRIAEILDKYDYEGSMIYDEYPDRFSLYRIADTIGKILERESGKVAGALIQVLVCDELYKRRHGGKRGMIAFLEQRGSIYVTMNTVNSSGMKRMEAG